MLLQYKPLRVPRCSCTLLQPRVWTLITVSYCRLSHSSSTTVSTNSTILPMGAQSLFPLNLRGNAISRLHWVMCSAILHGCAPPCSPGSSPATAWSCSGWPKGQTATESLGLQTYLQRCGRGGLVWGSSILRWEPPWGTLHISPPKGVRTKYTVIPCLSQKHCSQHRAWCWIVTAKSRNKTKPVGSWDLVAFSFTSLQRDHSFLYRIYSALS